MHTHTHAQVYENEVTFVVLSVCAVRVCNATELALRVVVKQDHVRTSVLPSNWFGGGAYESAKTFARP